MIQGGKFPALRDPGVFCCIFQDPRACTPALPDPRGFSTRFPGSTWFQYLPFEIHVVLRPTLRDPRVRPTVPDPREFAPRLSGSTWFSPRLSGSTWFCAPPSQIHVLVAAFFCCFFLNLTLPRCCFPGCSWLFCSSMACPKGGGPADEEAAAEATVTAIVKELEARFDVDLGRCAELWSCREVANPRRLAHASRVEH